MKHLRLISLIMAILMIASFAFACTSEDEKDNNTQAATTTKATTTKKPVANPTGDVPPTVDLTPETPVTGDEFLEWHNSMQTVIALNPTTNVVAWGDSPFANLFDGKDGFVNADEQGTKFGGGDASPMEIYFEAPNTKLIAYAFVTGYDNPDFPGRTPETWTLYGSTKAPADATDDDWKVLDDVIVSGMVESGNTPFGFTIDEANQGTYSYYKIVISEKLGGGSIVQIGLNQLYLYEAKAQ